MATGPGYIDPETGVWVYGEDDYATTNNLPSGTPSFSELLNLGQRRLIAVVKGISAKVQAAIDAGVPAAITNEIVSRALQSAAQVIALIADRTEDLRADVSARLPLRTDQDDIAFSITDTSGRRSWLEVARTGGPTPHALSLLSKEIRPELLGSASFYSLAPESGYSFAITDIDGRVAYGIDQAGNIVGSSSAATATEWIACYGDSLTEGYIGWTGGYPAALARELNVTVMNRGSSGSDTSRSIAGRFNAAPLTITFPNGIPATGSAVATVAVPLLKGHNFSALNLQLSNGIYGTLRWVAVDGIYRFTRLIAGAAIAAGGFTATFDNGELDRNKPLIIWAGYNNRSDPNQIKSDIAAMLARQTTYPKRFLVLGVITAVTEGTGTTQCATTTQLNADLAALYGDNYVDIRRYLIDAALAAGGRTPTAADTEAIGRDTIPPQLLSDGLHPFDFTYTLIAKFLAPKITSKAWF